MNKLDKDGYNDQGEQEAFDTIEEANKVSEEYDQTERDIGECKVRRRTERLMKSVEKGNKS